MTEENKPEPQSAKPAGADASGYGEGAIQILEGLEAVRKRPGMYIGSTGERGLHHLVYEIVDNAIDEALAGYCDHIEVKILKGDIIQVTDNGRGIPVDIQAQTGRPAPRLLPALLFGLTTVVFPFFVMQPALGAGIAASRTPSPWRARMHSLVMHAVFGLGLYASAMLIRQGLFT